jgi:hypothetical protein
VLNGTTFEGLAARTLDQLASAGYRRGSSGNAADQTRQQSAVAYAPGFEEVARRIATRLRIRRVQRLDAATRAQEAQVSPNAPAPDVVVLLGADQYQ